MGPKGPPLANTGEPARSLASGQCQCVADRPLPGHGHLVDDGEIFTGQIRYLGCPARPDLPAYLSKTQHLQKTGMSLFIIRKKS